MLLLMLESKTKCAARPQSSVFGRAAAKDDDYLLCSALRGIQNHFPDAGRRRKIDIVLVRLQATHAGRFTHFHHGELLVLDPAVTRFDLASERILRFTFHPRSAERLRDDFRSAFAAVGHRRDVDLGIRQNIAKPTPNATSSFCR